MLASASPIPCAALKIESAGTPPCCHVPVRVSSERCGTSASTVEREKPCSVRSTLLSGQSSVSPSSVADGLRPSCSIVKCAVALRNCFMSSCSGCGSLSMCDLSRKACRMCARMCQHAYVEKRTLRPGSKSWMARRRPSVPSCHMSARSSAVLVLCLLSSWWMSPRLCRNILPYAPRERASSSCSSIALTSSRTLPTYPIASKTAW
mmetsp:Transcript_8701/g.27390  ORF Transcript_8701/g.27390 Transcript_8701/m.27390 type:complete len:206 (-) Transcript_8701:534-1151(-)